MEIYILCIVKENTEDVVDFYQDKVYGNVANHIAGVFSTRELAKEAWDKIKSVAFAYWIMAVKLDEPLFEIFYKTITINKTILIRKD